VSFASTPGTRLAPETADLQSAPVIDMHGRRMHTESGIVVEHTTDLAVADRVAYIMAVRSGRTHVVFADTAGFAIVQLFHSDTPIALPAAVVSIATDSGIRPVLDFEGSQA
jgi:hypothetical protein